MSVASQHEDYKRMSLKWQRCRDVAAGQDAVHAARETYLPKLKDQQEADYKAYVERATFYNATWRTIAGLRGMIFRQPPAIEAPESVKTMLEDVTMSGVPFQLFLQTVCEEALQEGRIGVLVDYPSVNVLGLTLLDAKKQNLRPMMQTYLAESIINWKTGRVNNVTVLTMVVLKESVQVAVDEFTANSETRYRVLDLVEQKYRVRIFKVEGEKDVQIGTDVYPQMGNKPLDFIPFIFIGTDDVTPEVDDPPLIDLVDVNLSHYRSTADLENGAHFTGLPTPIVSGHRMEKEGEKLYIGSSTAWVLPQADAKAYFLEFTGKGLDALERRLESKEKQMAILGARMLEPQKKAVETAEKDAQNRKGEESMLSSCAQAISLGATKALGWFCTWAGAESANATVDLNHDFYPAKMTPQELTALVSAWQQGAISEQVMFENLQQGEIIGQEVTLEEEQERKASEGPTLTGQPVGKDGKPLAPPALEKPAAPLSHTIVIQLPKGGGKRTVTGPGGQKYVIEEAA